MSDPYFQSLFADRIGGAQYGKGTDIYKFEKIKRAKRAAIAVDDGEALAALCRGLTISFARNGSNCRVLLNGEDVLARGEDSMKDSFKKMGKAVGQAGKEVGKSAAKAGKAIGRESQKVWYRGVQVSKPALEKARAETRRGIQQTLAAMDRSIASLKAELKRLRAKEAEKDAGELFTAIDREISQILTVDFAENVRACGYG